MKPVAQRTEAEHFAHYTKRPYGITAYLLKGMSAGHPKAKGVIARIKQIDSVRAVNYFAKHGVIFDPNSPKTIPKLEAQAPDVLREIKTRSSEWKKTSFGGASVVNTDMRDLRAIAQKVDTYKKQPKLPICKLIMGSCETLVWQELGTVLKVCEALRKVENNPKFAKVKNELIYARELNEDKVLDLLSGRMHPAEEVQWYSFWGELVDVAQVVQAKLSLRK